MSKCASKRFEFRHSSNNPKEHLRLTIGSSSKQTNEIIKCHSRTHNSQSCPVERAVAAAEGGIGDDLAPGLAHEGCADDARRLSCRDAEEDLADEVVHQLRRRHDAGLAASSGSTVTGLADGDARRLHVAQPGWQWKRGGVVCWRSSGTHANC